MQAALQLLTLLTRRYPPEKGAHSLTRTPTGRLRVSIHLPGMGFAQSYLLDEEDLYQRPEDLVEVLAKLVEADLDAMPRSRRR